MWRKVALAAAVGLPALAAATSMAMAEDIYVIDDDDDDAVIVETEPVVVEKPVVVFKNYEDEWEADNRVTCSQALDAIEDLGFDQVVRDECSGSTYTFVGNRDGDVYVIRVNARTGEIVAG